MRIVKVRAVPFVPTSDNRYLQVWQVRYPDMPADGGHSLATFPLEGQAVAAQFARDHHGKIELRWVTTSEFMRLRKTRLL